MTKSNIGKESFLTNDAGKMNIQMHMKETRSLSLLLQKINSKQIKDINISLETLKLLEEMWGKHFKTQAQAKAF